MGLKLNMNYKFTFINFVYLAKSGIGRFNIEIKDFPITPAIPVPISCLIMLNLIELRKIGISTDPTVERVALCSM